MTRRTAGYFAAACLGLFLAGAYVCPARAAEAPAVRVVDLTYEVYLGGLHIFDFDAAVTLRANSYSVAVAGGTRGMLGWIYKWDLKLAAEGADDAGRIRPRSYVSMTDWQGKPRTMRLAFGAAGAYDVTRDPPEESDPQEDEGELPASLPGDVVDPLSFAVAASRAVAANGRCAQTLPLFDGKRRYDLIVSDLGTDALPANRYSIYQGPAMRCGFAMERISGFSKVRRNTRQSDEASAAPPTVWLASIRDGLPPLPVRYEGTIALGDMVIHLTKAELRSEVAEVPARP
ncbi:MAG TPA: DUF3108 domain-containing protein [Alphaproteobacteria bacterium]|jgi:hypothetical protein